MKKVVVFGACGNIGPFVTPGLEPNYHLTLTDIVEHPDGKPTKRVDVTDYEQTREACEGMDAIINLTVVRHDADASFHVNVKGAYHIMRAAADAGIKKVIHTGPEQVRRWWYDHEFDVSDPPHMPGTAYYFLTKHLSNEICKAYAREYGIQTLCFLFNLLRAKPTAPGHEQDFGTYTIVWEDLQHACKLGLELDLVPDDFQALNLMSYMAHGKYNADKAKRILGYEPLERVEDWHKRSVD